MRPLLLAGVAALAAGAQKKPVPLIIDTDMSVDVDDVVAVCAAHAMADRGEAEILGIVHDVGWPAAIGAVSVLNHWYGRDDIPIGAYKGLFGKDPTLR